jgi:hypothetical protein
MKIAFSTTLVCLMLLLFALIPALAQEGPDENEPNNTRGHATSIDGLTIDGEVGRGDDDVDWYKLESQEGYNPTITLTYNDSRCDIDLDVYSDRDLVASLTGTDSPDSDSFDIPGTCYLKVYAYEGHGAYTIDIEPGEGDNTGSQDCAGPDEVESNDTKDVADVIDGTMIEGYACEDDVDWYVLEGQEGYNPTITLTYDDNGCDINLDVYSDRDLVASLTGTDSPDSDSFDIPGTCYLKVYAYDGEGEYTIDIEPAEENGNHGNHNNQDCQGNDEVEPNDTKTHATSIDGTTIDGYACEDDVDWFKIEGLETHRPTFTLTFDDEECDIDLDVYSDDELVGSLTGTSSPDSDEFRVRGDCYLKVYAYDGEGDYTIEIEE